MLDLCFLPFWQKLRLFQLLSDFLFILSLGFYISLYEVAIKNGRVLKQCFNCTQVALDFFPLNQYFFKRRATCLSTWDVSGSVPAVTSWRPTFRSRQYQRSKSQLREQAQGHPAFPRSFQPGSQVVDLELTTVQHESRVQGLTSLCYFSTISYHSAATRHHVPVSCRQTCSLSFKETRE